VLISWEAGLPRDRSVFLKWLIAAGGWKTIVDDFETW